MPTERRERPGNGDETPSASQAKKEVQVHRQCQAVVDATDGTDVVQTHQ
jgi:hypothetical protein